MIKRIDKITIFVSSQEEAKKFWTEKLGFVITFEQEMGPGMKWIEASPVGENNTTLVLYSKEAMQKQNPAVVHHPLVMFKSDNPEEEWKSLNEKGVEVTDIQKMPYGTMFSFKDNDGNTYMVRN